MLGNKEIKPVLENNEEDAFVKLAAIGHKDKIAFADLGCRIYRNGQCPDTVDNNLAVPICRICPFYRNYNGLIILPRLKRVLKGYEVEGKLNEIWDNRTVACADYRAIQKVDSTHAILKEFSMIAVGKDREKGLKAGVLFEFKQDLNLKIAEPPTKPDPKLLEVAGGSVYLYLLMLKQKNFKMINSESMSDLFNAAREELKNSGLKLVEAKQRINDLVEFFSRQGPSFK